MLPCDDLSGHSCNITFLENDRLDINFGKEIDTGSNSGKFKISLKILEGRGSGIVSDGSEENIKLFIARQYTHPEQSYLEILTNSHRTSAFPLKSSSFLDKDCSVNSWGIPPYRVLNYLINNRGWFEIAVDLSKLSDGTYWVFACLKDRIGNWTILIDPKQTSLLSTKNILSWQGEDNRKHLSIFNPNGFQHKNQYPKWIKAKM